MSNPNIDVPLNNPWETQRVLMEASGQPIAQGHPELNKGTVLYSALCMEELSEMLEGVTEAMNRAVNDELIPQEARERITRIYTRLDNAFLMLHEESLAIRAELKQVPNFATLLTKDEARKMADGSTDIIVVSSGVSVSSGLKGEASHVEIVGSNLSKRNPDTGIIDISPDGKWIPGSAYYKPDLLSILYPNGDEGVPADAPKAA